jgi:hypothetical protein
MPKGMRPIFTRTLSANSSGITFNNIPQNYDDLYVLISGRIASGAIYGNIALQVNGVTSGTSYYTHRLTGNGTGISSDRIAANNFIYVGEVSGDTATASTFGTCTIYIPNYTSEKYKQVIMENVSENNTNASFVGIHSGLIQQFTPINSITLSPVGTLLTGCTFTLYGIGK